jgi:hypothetical protein
MGLHNSAIEQWKRDPHGQNDKCNGARSGAEQERETIHSPCRRRPARRKRMIGAIADRENPFRPVREILDASQRSPSWPLQAAECSWRNRDQDAMAKHDSRRRLLRRPKSPWRAPRFRRDFFNSLPRGFERGRPGRTPAPNLARCRPELVTALETAYALRMKEVG